MFLDYSLGEGASFFFQCQIPPGGQLLLGCMLAFFLPNPLHAIINEYSLCNSNFCAFFLTPDFEEPVKQNIQSRFECVWSNLSKIGTFLLINECHHYICHNTKDMV